jgi:hypothetical protein
MLKHLMFIVCKIIKRHRRKLRLSVSYDGILITGNNMTTLINDQQKFTLVASETTGGPSPVAVPISGVPLWVGSDDAVATILVASDGLSVVVTGIAPGSMSVNCSVDGLTATEFVSVTAVPNVLVLTAQAPEQK